MNCTIEHTWNVKRLLEFIFESKSQRDIRHTGGLLGAWSLSPIICERPSATARPGSIFMIIFWGEISIYLLQTNGANGAWWGWTPVWAYKLVFKFHMLGSCKDSQLCLVSNFDDTQYLLVCLWISIVISSVCSPSVGFYKELELNICTWTQHYALSTRNIFSTQLCPK